MIPVNSIRFTGNEKKYVCEAIDSGWIGGGSFIERFEKAFAKWSHNKYAVAICNGTCALETAIYSANIKDEIYLPTGTIISCLIAAYRNSLNVKVYDIDVPVTNIMRCHLFGKKSNLKGTKIVDDCSQYWQPLRVQDVGVYSLYTNKLVTTGEGGMLVTNKEVIYNRAKRYINLCHTKERFVHDKVSANFRMSNLQAAVGLAQLEQIDKTIKIKQKNRDLYLKYLPESVEILFNVKVPWVYLIKTQRNAKRMVTKMRELGVDCRRYFCPIHLQPCVSRPKPDMKFAHAQSLWEHAFYLPSGTDLTKEDVKYVCTKLKEIL